MDEVEPAVEAAADWVREALTRHYGTHESVPLNLAIVEAAAAATRFLARARVSSAWLFTERRHVYARVRVTSPASRVRVVLTDGGQTKAAALFRGVVLKHMQGNVCLQLALSDAAIRGLASVVAPSLVAALPEAARRLEAETRAAVGKKLSDPGACRDALEAVGRQRDKRARAGIEAVKKAVKKFALSAEDVETSVRELRVEKVLGS